MYITDDEKLARKQLSTEQMDFFIKNMKVWEDILAKEYGKFMKDLKNNIILKCPKQKHIFSEKDIKVKTIRRGYSSLMINSKRYGSITIIFGREECVLDKHGHVVLRWGIRVVMKIENDLIINGIFVEGNENPQIPTAKKEFEEAEEMIINKLRKL